MALTDPLISVLSVAEITTATQTRNPTRRPSYP